MVQLQEYWSIIKSILWLIRLIALKHTIVIKLANKLANINHPLGIQKGVSQKITQLETNSLVATDLADSLRLQNDNLETENKLVFW